MLIDPDIYKPWSRDLPYYEKNESTVMFNAKKFIWVRHTLLLALSSAGGWVSEKKFVKENVRDVQDRPSLYLLLQG